MSVYSVEKDRVKLLDNDCDGKLCWLVITNQVIKPS